MDIFKMQNFARTGRTGRPKPRVEEGLAMNKVICVIVFVQLVSNLAVA